MPEPSTKAMPLSATLPGTWQLLSRIDVTAAGERKPEPSLGDDPIALLIYDRSGHFAAQFMRRDRSVVVADAAGSGSNNSRARDGYDAYFGTYVVDDRTNAVTQTLVGEIPPNLGTTEVATPFRLRGDTLQLGGDSVAHWVFVRVR